MIVHISQKLKDAVKLSSIPAYKIAWGAGVHPSTLSKLLRGIERPKPNDPRIVAVGAVIGLAAAECFEEEEVPGREDQSATEGP